MEFKLDHDPAKEWAEIFKFYKREGGDAFQFARKGAQLAGEIVWNIFDPADTRRKKLNRVRDDVRSLLNKIEKTHKDKTISEWLRGYWEFYTQNHLSARQYFYGVMKALGNNPDFLVDIGRFEYNCGRLKKAQGIFERVYDLQEYLSVQPMQAYRWLSKTYYHLKKYDCELEILDELKEFLEESPDNFNDNDFGISYEFFVTRYGLSLLNNNQPEEAFEFIEDAINLPSPILVSPLAFQGVRALHMLDRDKEAGEWAEKWAVKLNNPAIFGEYLRSSKLPYSAFKRKEKILLSQANKNQKQPEKFIFYSDSENLVEEISGDLKSLYYEVQSCFNSGYHEEGVEALFRFADRFFESGEAPTLMANCLALINAHRSLFPQTLKLEAMFQEAFERWPNNPAILSQFGQFLLYKKQPEEALSHFLRAGNCGGNKYALFSVLLAKAYGDLGDHDQAKRFFSKALNNCQREDLVEAYKEAIEWATTQGFYLDAFYWGQNFRKDFLGASGFPEQELGAVAFPKNKYLRTIFKLSGQAALALGEYNRALEYFDMLLANFGSFLSLLPVKNNSPFSYQHIAEATLLLAQAYILKGDLGEAENLLIQAEVLDSKNALLPSVRAMLFSQLGNFKGAIDQVLKSEMDEWLVSLAGGYILEVAQSRGIAREVVSDLSCKVGMARGTLPTYEDLFKRFETQSNDLVKAEERAREMEATCSVFRQSFRSFMERIPLPEAVADAKRKILEDLDRSKGVEESVDRFVSEIVKQYGKNQTKESRYAEWLREGQWPRLDRRIQERILAADQYVVTITKSAIDFGPAVLSLTSALEILLKSLIFKPFYFDLQRHDRSLEYKTKANLKYATLGTLPFLLGAKGDNEPQFRQFVENWINTKFPSEKDYLFNVLPRKVERIAEYRNSWAHGGPGVNSEDFRELESMLFNHADGIFVRLL